MLYAVEAMRRVILFIISVGMVVGGSYLLILQFTVSTIIYFRWIFAGGALVAIGASLLWEDFVAPMIRGRTRDT